MQPQNGGSDSVARRRGRTRVRPPDAALVARLRGAAACSCGRATPREPRGSARGVARRAHHARGLPAAALSGGSLPRVISPDAQTACAQPGPHAMAATRQQRLRAGACARAFTRLPACARSCSQGLWMRVRRLIRNSFKGPRTAVAGSPIRSVVHLRVWTMWDICGTFVGHLWDIFETSV